MSVSLQNHRKLDRAMRQMLDGTIEPPDGKITWKGVAVMAGVSKATADRATDLRTEFRRLLAEQQPTPAAPASTRRSRTDADEELTKLRHDIAELKHSTKTLHSVILVLVHENEQLKRRTRRRSNVVDIDTPSPDGTDH